MNAVFFEANDDPITKAVHVSRRKVLEANSAFPEYRLFGHDAHHTDVRATHTSGRAFHLFSGMAHGGNDHVTGQYNSILFSTTDAAQTNYTVKGAIVHLFSCNCGKELGPHLVKNGAKAFIGYVAPVEIGSSQGVTDEFVKVAAAIDNSIISGDSHAISKRKADSEFSAAEARLLASPIATPRDVVVFRFNNRSMVGPWTHSNYGSY